MLALNLPGFAPKVAEKDGKAPLLKDSDVNFEYRG